MTCRQISISAHPLQEGFEMSSRVFPRWANVDFKVLFSKELLVIIRFKIKDSQPRTTYKALNPDSQVFKRPLESGSAVGNLAFPTAAIPAGGALGFVVELRMIFGVMCGNGHF
jgi:hypothetical protein